MTATGERWRFALVAALLAALGFFAWRSGRTVYERGPELEVTETAAGVVLEWSHAIEAPMAKRFAAAFEEYRDKTDRFVIDLDSPGGAVAEGRLVIAAIEAIKRTHRVDTLVGRGAYCLSMCVPIYLAGDRRVAAPDATFMFHEPSSYDLVTDERIDRPGFEARMTSARFFERYFGRSEMNSAWRERLKERWRGKDLWLTAEELVSEGANVVETLSE